MPLRARNREAPAKLCFALIQTLKTESSQSCSTITIVGNHYQKDWIDHRCSNSTSVFLNLHSSWNFCINCSTFHKILLSKTVLRYVNNSFSKNLELFRIIDSLKSFRTDPSITVLIQKGPCKSSLRRWYNIIYVTYHPGKLEVARFPIYGPNKERSWNVLHGFLKLHAAQGPQPRGSVEALLCIDTNIEQIPINY